MWPGGRQWPLWVVSWLLLTGCPTYNDTYSGTYQQVEVDPLSERRSVKVDFFRYGDNARAIIRYFKPDVVTNDPFGKQTFCAWTWADNFNDENQKFHLPIQRSSKIGNGRLSGKAVDKQTLEVAVYDEETGEPLMEERRLERVQKTPDPNCDTIGEFLIRPTFNLHSTADNVLPRDTVYRIGNPVFAVQWVGLRRVQNPATSESFLVRTNSVGPTVRLDSSFLVKDGEGLRGVLSLPLSPPKDKILMRSGQTRFAIGHLVVIDDLENEGRFQWDTAQEPIVASSLQRGRRSGAPSEPYPPDGSGKVLLFVEGKLDQLGDDFFRERISGLDSVSDTSRYLDSHFYIAEADVSFQQNEILNIRLDSFLRSPLNRNIPLKVTDLFLGDPSQPLPRVLPLD